jgi:hypothetical protein
MAEAVKPPYEIEFYVDDLNVVAPPRRSDTIRTAPRRFPRAVGRSLSECALPTKPPQRAPRLPKERPLK